MNAEAVQSPGSIVTRPLLSAQMVMAVPSGDDLVHFHADCFMLWDDERRIPSAPRSAPQRP